MSSYRVYFEAILAKETPHIVRRGFEQKAAQLFKAVWRLFFLTFLSKQIGFPLGRRLAENSAGDHLRSHSCLTLILFPSK
jgi:hypothetical protein